MASTTSFISGQKNIEHFLPGDKKAFDQIYDQYAPLLYGMIHRLTEDETEAEQVLKLTFIRLWQDRATYCAHQGSLLSFLMNTARQIALSFTKSGEIVEIIAQPANQNGSGYVSINSTYTSHSTIDHSETELQDKVLQMMYVYGKSPQEVAIYLNTTSGEVTGIVRSAINRLKGNSNE